LIIVISFFLSLSSERNNTNNNSTSTIIPKGPPSPEFSKNFEYLIRRELDVEHAPLKLHSSMIFILIFDRQKNKRESFIFSLDRFSTKYFSESQ